MGVKEAEIHVTDECFHNCVFCSVKKHSSPTPDLEEIKKNIILAKPFSKLTFSGGEVLLRKDLVDIISFAKTKKKYTLVETNLILLNEKLVKELVNAGLDELKISFHSHKQNPYEKITQSKNFKRLLTSMESLRNKGARIKVSVNIVITKYNCRELDKTIEFLEIKFPFIEEIRVSYPRFYPIKGHKDYSKEYLFPLKKIKKPLEKINKNKKIIFENIPLCIINDKRAEKINWNIWLIKKGKIKKGWEGRYFPKKCLVCKKKKICSGLHKHYPLYFDESFVKPFK